MTTSGRAAVTVTTATGGSGICSNKAVGGAAPAFTTLGPITIYEGANGDFATGTDVIIFNAPAGWQFNSTVPTFTFVTGSNITAISGSITSASLTVSVSVSGITSADQFTISGLQVQATSTSSGAGNIYASSVSGITGITSGSFGTSFGAVSLTTPLTPSVTISGSPSGAICPGTNVLFTPAIANGGAAPSFQWSLNGTPVWIGGTYNNNTLSNGNTISCIMTSSGTCLTTNPVASNTVTMTVVAAPAAVTGTMTICPTMTAALSDATTGGAWSSGNTAVATIASTGVVTGVAQGTATISYLASGCNATTTMYINAPPMAPALTPTATAICNDGSVTISVGGTLAPGTILTQNFNSSIAPWTIDNTGSSGTLAGSEWKTCGDGYINEQGLYHSPDNSTFVMSNSDTSGSLSVTVSKLISPVFSLVGYSTATVSFQHAYDYWPSGDVNVNLEISTNGGSTWSIIANYIGSTIGAKTSFVAQSYSLNAYLGNPNTMIRFNYNCHWGYYWAIDNVLITGTPSLVTPTWSPVTYLFTNPGFSTPYTTGATNTVYMHPTGVVSAVVMTYTATATQGGCSSHSVSVVTVNPSPGTTTGNLNICAGTTTTLVNAVSGGTWTTSNSAIATVGSGSGIVTGVATGTATISYILGAGCVVTSVVTVSTTPASITGPANICLGQSYTFTDATTGGTWSSSNSSVAPIVYSSGIITGAVLGTAVITYSLDAGCTAILHVTVQPLPLSVTGTPVVCAGLTTTLADATSGGSWISGNTSIATVGSGTGVVTGAAEGTAIITFMVTATGCASTMPVTVNPLAPIAGNTSICLGLTSTLTDAAAGGTWSSSSLPIAIIGSTTGIVSGLALGTSNITYLFSGTGCAAYATVTVNPLPADITGTAVVCTGAATTLSDATTGGTWSSGTPAVASVGATGIVNGLLAGTSVITYTLPTGCIKTITITVNPLPAAITGTATVCAGLTTALDNASSGGTWTSTNTTYATVAGTGVVSALAAGTLSIVYTLPTSCFISRSVTVNPLPAGITGTDNVCQGQTATLADATSGGTWGSSNTSIANIGVGGVILGGIAGTATITYTLANSCIATWVVTVNALPSNISGPSAVCVAATVNFTDATPGGTWSGSNAALATVTTTGDVTGIASGTINITYTVSTGCIKTTPVTVNPIPVNITGTTGVCVGLSTILSDVTTGGSWSSGNTLIASVAPATGSVFGAASGNTTITYALATGCAATTLVTVFPLPVAITGNANICYGLTSVLADATSGGSWSSSNSSIAGVGSSTGIVTGAGLGNAIITYTLPTSCIATSLVTVNPLPATIVGSLTVCVGSATIFNTTSIGGSWASSNTSVATIGSTSGMASGIAAGTAIISYILPTGCIAIKAITVNPIPATITGSSNICQGASAILGNTTTAGIWSSNTTAVATIGSLTGVVNGLAGGITIISYTLSTGCYAVLSLTVTALPSAITGYGSVCEGSQILLSDATSGGSWSSSNTSIAAIGSNTGVVSGLVAGTTTIVYSLPLGCSAATILTVNPLPLAITGTTTLCVGQPVTLTDATPGGSWASGSPFVANINPSTGIALGYVIGTASISYYLPTGCTTTKVVTVNIMPATIAGASSVCLGFNTVLTNGVGGGTWSSSNTAIAGVGSATGVVSGLAYGTVTITYSLPSGCFVTKALTVNTLPLAITGAPAICQGLSTTLSCSTSGGSWTSGNPFVASVSSSSGLLNGVAAGTATITYTLGTGCYSTYLMTIYALPSPIGGNAGICPGTTSVLTTTTPGGTWISGDPTIATIDPGTALVTGVALGTSTITYTLGIGCSVNKIVTVNPLPTAIGGSLSACPGLTAILTDSSPGGSWATGISSVATVNSVTGTVSALAAGTSVISYSLGTGCFVTAIFTVDAVAPVIGSSGMCVGAVNILSHSVSGGTWVSSNTAVANVSLTSGVTIGYSLGTANITYTLPGGCVAIAHLTVNALPSAITGGGSVCPGFTLALNDATTGGSWSSTNPSFASVGSATGIVTGIVAGTSPSYVSIVYSLPFGCSVSKTITVNPLPAAITGPGSICVGTSATLSSAAPSGTWSSSNTSVASVGLSSGLLNGLATGTTSVTYTPPTGCVATITITVNGLPVAISGTTNLCAGSSYTLSDGTSGGVWSSTNTAAASIGSTTGLVTSGIPGTSTISYTLGVGCAATVVVTTNVMPSAIAGLTSVCQGYVISMSTTPSGGSWTSSNAPVASVVSTTGSVTGVAPGTATISYSMPSGCRVMATVTVSAPPSVVTGITNACVGLTSVLSDPAAGGGTWSSNSTIVATIGVASGVVTGIASGTTIITYTVGSGCTTVTGFTVNPLPAGITGTFNACVGLTTTLNDGTPGGTWASGNTTVATIGAGTVNGLVSGTSVITYTLPTGCIATQMVTINPLPSSVSGITNICQGAVTTLANGVPGGSWSSSNTAVGTVGITSGIVTGIGGGTTMVSYTLGAGCSAQIIVTVYPLPSAIGGSANVCQGLTTTLSNGTPGGSWGSSDISIATISSGGVVSGIVPGTATITYTVGTGCRITLVVTVHPLSTITGITTLCAGFTTSLANANSGGTWSSSNPSVAVVNATTGIVSGMAAGTDVITYLLPSGCRATITVSVIPVTAITGGTTVCAGQTLTVANSYPGGTWASSNSSVAAINTTSGVVTGIVAGTTLVSYTFGNGCVSTSVLTVYPLSANTGIATVCVGLSTTLSNATSGGTWASSNLTVASVVSATGMVSGLISGTSVISYILPTGCVSTTIVTVNPLSPVTGTAAVCVGATTTLGNANGGGTWSSSSTAIAPVGTFSGIVTGSTSGTATIYYTLGSGCSSSVVVTVNPLPAAIAGSLSTCTGSSSNLTDASSTGTWSSSVTSVASVGSLSGVVSGFSAGTSALTYTLSTGCAISAVFTVNPLPAPITGTLLVCEGGSGTLLNSATGGTWSSLNTAIATAGITSGVVNGIATGTATVVYTLPTGCFVTDVVTVNGLPASISGALNVCAGSATILSDPSPGGAWSSDDISVATVSASGGLVSGIAAGVVAIRYSLGTGCYRSATVTVNPLPSAITGALNVCNGSTNLLSSATTGGAWISSNTSVAAIDAITGAVTGVAVGTSSISYALTSGCVTVAVVSVNPLPAGISVVGSSPARVCEGAAIAFADATPSGTWSSSAIWIASVGSSGIATGFSAGTTKISYSLSTGCYSSVILTVNSLPAAITGVPVLCQSSTTALSNTAAGGSWSSSNVAIATVDLTTGMVSGIAPGTATITYSLATGCAKTIVVTVNLAPAAISGPSQVCAGATATLTNTTAGGAWSSTASAGVLFVSSGGLVNGIAAGTATIYYTLSNGCAANRVFIVNPLPAAISSPGHICNGQSAALADVTPGGIWASGATATVTISSSGLVSGIAAGSSVITYTLATGCYAVIPLFVDPLPGAIAGPSFLCAAANINLSDPTTGGTWASSNTAVATVGIASGAVSGIDAGTATISYSLPTGCAVNRVVTVNPLPSVISGGSNACLGSAATFGNTIAGGTWASSSTSVITIDAATGAASGVTIGAAFITYTLPTGCLRTLAVAVNPVPLAIAGSLNLCQGIGAMLTDASPSGVWSSVPVTTAIVGSSTGVVTGLLPGTATIFYSFATGCKAATVVTINPLLPVTGSNVACVGDTLHMSDGTAGGTWTSSTTSVASVSGSGVVVAYASGIAVISYALASGCVATISVTVNPLPVAFIVTGGGTYCSGNPGVHVGLNGSVPGYGYSLYNGTVEVGYLHGTGLALDFGLQTLSGTYTVFASNLTFGCSRAMFSSVTVTMVTFGPAGVSIASSVGDTACASSVVTFSAVTYLGGSVPLFHWFVNGAAVSTAASYTYLPSDADIVSCHLTSNASCAVPDTATASRMITVIPDVMPSVSIAVAPGDTLCQFSPVIFTPSPVFGGVYPQYRWLKNGSLVDTGISYSCTPASGDNIYCIMTSGERCLTSDTAVSNTHTMTVVPYTVPTVNVTASPGFEIGAGVADTFTAIVANGGPAPSYQWFVNSSPIPGATNAIFVKANCSNQDSVSCTVVSSGSCSGISASGSGIVTVLNVGITVVPNGIMDLRIVPNPNNGSFVLQGTMNGLQNESVSIQVTDVLGQVIFGQVGAIIRGRVNMNVVLTNAISNGVYLLSVRSGSHSSVLHFVIQQ